MIFDPRSFNVSKSLNTFKKVLKDSKKILKKIKKFKNYLKWGGVIDHGHLTAIPADKWKLRDNENYNFNNESDYVDDDPDLRFVKKITRPDFQAKTFTH